MKWILPKEVHKAIKEPYDEMVTIESKRITGALDLQARMQLIDTVDSRMRKAANRAIDRLTRDLRKSLHMDNIGKLLKDRRDTLGKTQDDVQRETGLSRSVLSRYENGKRKPTNPRSIYRLNRALWPR